MAIVQCAECGSEISDQAKACPKCGAPLPKKKGGCLPVLLVLIALAVVAAFVLGAMGNRLGTPGAAYTGKLRIDNGTEYVMEEAPSPIGGACTGWNAVSIQPPNQPSSGMRELMCWRRSGDDIETQGPHGENLKSVPSAAISD